MTMRVFSIQHDRQGLSEVERISSHTTGLAEHVLACPAVVGAIVVATCNRVEVLVDGDTDVDALRNRIDAHFDVAPDWDLFIGEAALEHVFNVASGLNSMVLGEREIAGQLRRALTEAQEAGHTSLPLTIAVEEALKTSRQIANRTNLDAAGRSVVSQGLRLVGIDDWHGARVLIVGTGSYAGAVVAALRTRGVQDIVVHSASGRADEFAASHGIGVVQDVFIEMGRADLVITCRGRGPMIFPHHVSAGMRLLDLSIIHDVDREVRAVEGVTLVDLETIQANVEPRYEGDTEVARQLVVAGVARTMARLRARIVDPAVARLREAVMDIVADEMDRLPNRQLTRDDAARALRRLATRLLHVPSTRARLAAEEGRADEYLHAIGELYGIVTTPNPDRIDDGQCPVTLATMDDLEANKEQAS